MEQIIQPRHEWFENIKLSLTSEYRTWILKHESIRKRHDDDKIDVHDINLTFSFLSTENNYSHEIAEVFLKTHLPEGFRLYETRKIPTKGLFQTPLLKGFCLSYVNKLTPVERLFRTYEDLFNEIGSDCENHIFKVNGRKVNGYPDSVYLVLKKISETELMYEYV